MSKRMNEVDGRTGWMVKAARTTQLTHWREKASTSLVYECKGDSDAVVWLETLGDKGTQEGDEGR